MLSVFYIVTQALLRQPCGQRQIPTQSELRLCVDIWMDAHPTHLLDVLCVAYCCRDALLECLLNLLAGL
jgi:hypothetical protein